MPLGGHDVRAIGPSLPDRSRLRYSLRRWPRRDDNPDARTHRGVAGRRGGLTRAVSRAGLAYALAVGVWWVPLRPSNTAVGGRVPTGPRSRPRSSAQPPAPRATRRKSRGGARRCTRAMEMPSRSTVGAPLAGERVRHGGATTTLTARDGRAVARTGSPDDVGAEFAASGSTQGPDLSGSSPAPLSTRSGSPFACSSGGRARRPCFVSWRGSGAGSSPKASPRRTRTDAPGPSSSTIPDGPHSD